MRFAKCWQAMKGGKKKKKNTKDKLIEKEHFTY
jgi:hypothetical protein